MQNDVVGADIAPDHSSPAAYSQVTASIVTPAPLADQRATRSRWTTRGRRRDPLTAACRAARDGGIRGRIITGGGVRGTMSVTSSPRRGVVVVDADGTFSYTPRAAERARGHRERPVVDGFRAVLGDDRGRRSAVAVAPVVTAVDHRWPFAYTVNTMGSTDVTVDENPCGLALSADDARLYTVSTTTSRVIAIDTDTMTVVGGVDVCGHPSDLALDRSTGRLYVAIRAMGLVEVVDVATLEVIDAIAVAAPRSIAVVDRRAVLVATDTGEVVVVDVDDHATLARIPGCGRPRSLRVTADGRVAIVVDESSADARLHLISSPVDRPRLAGTFRADGFVFDAAVSPDGSRAHFVEDGTRSLMTVDLTTMRVAATVPLESFHTGVAVTADGRWVIVAAAFDDCVRMVDTETGEVVASAVTGAFSRHVLVGDDRAYVTTTDGITAVGGPLCGAIVSDDATPCRTTLAAAPRHGTVAVSEDGGFVYVPSGLVVDGDEFTVSVDDGRRAPVLAVVPVIAGVPGSA